MASKLLRRTAILLGATTLVVPLAMTPAAALPSSPAAAADAYGLLVDVRLLPTHTPVKVGGRARARRRSFLPWPPRRPKPKS